MTSLHIGNVPIGITEDQLREHFAPYGELKSVRRITTPTGVGRGFAFVDFVSEEDAKKAIAACNESDLAGNKILVDFARQKQGEAPRMRPRDPRGPRPYQPDRYRAPRDYSPERYAYGGRWRGDPAYTRYPPPMPPMDPRMWPPAYERPPMRGAGQMPPYPYPGPPVPPGHTGHPTGGPSGAGPQGGPAAPSAYGQPIYR
jgi:hypothetical protein